VSEPAVGAPALVVETVEADDIGLLIPLLDPIDPLLFIRRGEGVAGIGEALRLEFTGPTRIRDAAAAWREIVAAASVTDPISLPGTGLVALGSFAFSEHSSATSVLIVPSVVIGRRGRHSWVTRINSTGPTPVARALGAEYRVSLEPGAMSPMAFIAAVDAAIAEIRGGGLSKVVLARDLLGRLPAGADLRRALVALALGYPDCFTYAVNGLLGSSPELLVKVYDGSVSARVLAGSHGRGADEESDLEAAVALATSTKDLDEHHYALASVMGALAPHSSSLAASELPFTLKLPNLWHLASDVEGELSDGSTSLDLVASLHPTAAVAGAPTPAALEVITRLEPFDRGRYSGPVGWVGASGDGEWAIALRCAQVSPEGIVTAYAGAGIVRDSEPDRELAETKMKFRPIVEAFN
jgi:menaquinone-specific isochorismate synthase